jgi:hypothetical protein
MKKYEVLMSESVAKWIEVEADNENDAIKKVEQGYWSDENVTKEECLDRSVESADEVIDD